MKGKTSAKNQGIKMEDAIDFIRKSALVEEKSGNPTLTARGERFLREHQESSSRPPSESSLPDNQSFSEGGVSR
jgi:hypothetical protein